MSTLLEVAEFVAREHATLWEIAETKKEQGMTPGLDSYDSGKLVAYRNVLALIFPQETFQTIASIEEHLIRLREQKGE